MIYHFLAMCATHITLLVIIYIYVNKNQRKGKFIEHLRARLLDQYDRTQKLSRELTRVSSNFEVGLEEFKRLELEYRKLEKSFVHKRKSSRKKK